MRSNLDTVRRFSPSGVNKIKWHILLRHQTLKSHAPANPQATPHTIGYGRIEVTALDLTYKIKWLSFTMDITESMPKINYFDTDLVILGLNAKHENMLIQKWKAKARNWWQWWCFTWEQSTGNMGIVKNWLGFRYTYTAVGFGYLQWNHFVIWVLYQNEDEKTIIMNKHTAMKNTQTASKAVLGMT